MNESIKGVFEIAALLIGVSVLTLILNRSNETAQVIQSAGGTFGNLLGIVTLQNSSLGAGRYF